MRLLREVARVLREAGVEHAIIGAAALAAHGVARATADVDVLVLDPVCLSASLWAGLRASGFDVEIRRGDASDPLAGVVRIAGKEEATVDLIVGRLAWQREALRGASPTRIGDADVPLVAAADLVLLKLYAGGPQDAWDVDQLLDVDSGLVASVEAKLGALSADSVALWRRILEQRSHRR